MIWLNCKCDNSEGNMCVCPTCKFNRYVTECLANGVQVSILDKEQYMNDLYAWNHRTDQLEANMKKRFPSD